MKTFTLFAGILFISNLSSGQADSWAPIVTDGFGNPQNYDIVEFESFKGNLFAAAGRSGTGAAQLWYSPTGNTGSWAQVTNFTPALQPSIKGIPSFGKTNLGGGIMWLGTGSNSTGTQIYRTTDGLNWTLMSKKGFGNPGLISPAPNMVVFQGTGDSIPYLYAGGGSHGGNTNAEVWRIPYNSTDSADWVKLIDFDTVATTMINDTVDLISYFNVWNNKIYFGANGKGQLWESSDGINFTQNLLGGTGYGFGVGSTIVVACLQVFHDSLFASTTNKQIGGQMYRTGDGINWQQVTANAFGKNDTAEELHNIDTAFGYIWVTAYTDTSVSNGCPIWRSSDGWNFVQSNTDGFGNPLIDGENAVTVSHGNHMYFGGPNYTAGAQIWRTDMTTGINEPGTKYSISIFPNPFTASAIIQFNMFISNGVLNIYNLYGQKEKTINNISGNKIKIDKENLPPGVYFIRLAQDDKTIATDKLIITD